MATTHLNPKAFLGDVQPLISGDPFELTSSWQDLGGRINTKGADGIAFWLKVIANASVNISFKIRCFKDEASLIEYFPPIYIVLSNKVLLIEEYVELNVDVDQNPIIDIYLGSYVPYIQLQVKDTNDSTGQIEAADVSFRIGQITHV